MSYFLELEFVYEVFIEERITFIESINIFSKLGGNNNNVSAKIR